MSVISQYPERFNNIKDVQIWNNAVFDNSCDKKPLSINRSSDSSFSSKENQSPTQIGLLKSSVLHQSKPLKNLPIMIGSFKNLDGKADEEIEIENEIARLYAKLESIRAKRVEQNGNNNVNKMVKKKDVGVKKIQESGFPKVQRRGFSMGPNEIMSANSLKSKQLGSTPVQSSQNRRKSCFWKLEDIEEKKLGFTRGKNLSLRQAVTTVGSKKGVKKDDLILGSIQPKKLFGEQVVSTKKLLKPGRVIPSRYNQATVNSSMRKRSLTDNIERQARTEGRVKKKWEIPSEILFPKRLDLDENGDEDENENESEDVFGSIDVVMPVVLPRIKAVRVVDETGRDSGPAKRVAELVGKKSYFAQEEAEEETVCQKLRFEEDCQVV